MKLQHNSPAKIIALFCLLTAAAGLTAGSNFYNANGTGAGFSTGNSQGGSNYYNANGTSAGYSSRNSHGGYNYYI